MFTVIFITACLIFGLAYLKYGKFLTRLFELDNRNKTPAHSMPDGVDYVPASAPVLFGHHFSSIAGAGPVLGPIIAGFYLVDPGLCAYGIYGLDSCHFQS